MKTMETSLIELLANKDYQGKWNWENDKDMKKYIENSNHVLKCDFLIGIIFNAKRNLFQRMATKTKGLMPNHVVDTMEIMQDIALQIMENPSRYNDLSLFLTRIKWDMINSIRKAVRQYKKLKPEYMDTYDNDKDTLHTIINNTIERKPIDKDMKTIKMDFDNMLTDTEKMILMLHYGDRLTYKELKMVFGRDMQREIKALQEKVSAYYFA